MALLIHIWKKVSGVGKLILQGLRYFLNEIYDRYHIPIMVVENGLGQDDQLEEDKTVHDDYRKIYETTYSGHG